MFEKASKKGALSPHMNRALDTTVAAVAERSVGACRVGLGSRGPV